MNNDSRKRPYIFDIDSTLANIDHRVNWILKTPKNWKAFEIGYNRDIPMLATINICNLLWKDNYPIILITGRPEHARKETVLWLSEHGIRYDKLYMKPGDPTKTSDDIFKRDALQDVRLTYGEPIGVFEDRQKVVRMWLDEGVFVFDVSQGMGEF